MPLVFTQDFLVLIKLFNFGQSGYSTGKTGNLDVRLPKGINNVFEQGIYLQQGEFLKL